MLSGSQTIFSRTQVQLLFCIIKNSVLCGVYTLGVVETWMLWPWRLRMPTLSFIVMFDRDFEVEVWLWFSSWSWVWSKKLRCTDFEAAWSKYRWWWCLVSGHLCCNKIFCNFGNFVRVTGISFLEFPFTTLISFSAESSEGPEERRQDCQRQVLLIRSCFSSWSWPG